MLLLSATHSGGDDMTEYADEFDNVAAEQSGDVMNIMAGIIKAGEGMPVDQQGNAAAYKDSKGIWTIGYGNTRIGGRAVREGDVVSVAEAEGMMMDHIYQDVIPKLEKLDGYEDMNPVQQAAVGSTIYNLGSLNDFPSMKRAISKGLWGEASYQLLTGDKDTDASKVFQQTGGRTLHAANALKYGKLGRLEDFRMQFIGQDGKFDVGLVNSFDRRGV